MYLTKNNETINFLERKYEIETHTIWNMKYKGKVEIKPRNHFIKCDINFSYVLPSETDELIVLLHKDIVIDSIISSGVDDFIIVDELSTDCPFILEARRVRLSLKKGLRQGDKLSIDFHYHGVVNIVTDWGVNRIDEEFCELGLYTPWFPLLITLPEATFDIDVLIPNEYTIINGAKLTQNENSYNINQDYPHNDCSFLAFKNAEIYGDEQIKIYYFKNQEMIAKNLFNVASDIFNYYKKTFGEVEIDKYLSFALPPRPDGGGYSRRGLIVMNLQEDNIKKYFPFIAHEIAHLWWNKANVNSWEDWLNESFAEYSSLLAIRSLVDIDKYNSRVNKYIEDSQELPKIKNISRSDDLAYPVLYKKGPVLLHRLESKVGNKSFIKLLRLKHREEIRNTDQFLSLITKLYGKELSNTFREWLEQ